ncbi:TPA: glycosyltransferase family 4 protein [Streptococcus suis]
MKKAVIIASVASMIDLFNMENIKILKSEGYEVDVVANFSNGSITSKKRVDEFKLELESMGIKVFNLPIPRNIFNLIDIFSSLKELIEIMNVNNYSLMHCHSPIGGVVARLASQLSKSKNRMATIYTAHGFHFFKGSSILSWLIFYPIERMLSRYTDLLITINKEDYNVAKKFKHPKVEYIPGIGIDTKKYLPKSNKDFYYKLKKEFGIHSDSKVFISVGQLSNRKNHQAVIRGLAKFKNFDFVYLLVGIGELKNDLEKLSTQLGIRDKVQFLGYRSNINDLLQIADIFVFPSKQEGLPVALMEAMASGLPIICSNIRGNSDLIEHGINGYLFNVHDIDQLEEYLSISFTENLDRFSMENLKRSKKYDTAIINNQMVAIYKQIEQKEI